MADNISISPIVSIVVPVYNSEKYVGRCLKSLLSQTLKNIEVVVVDDGSCDNSLDICEAFARKDSRIKVISVEHGGVSSARSHGIDIACGQYIGFVDSDDYVEENMYQVMLDNVEKKSSEICVVGYFTDDSGVLEVHDVVEGEFGHNEAMKLMLADQAFFTSMCNKLYLKNIITEKVPADLYMCEDYYFNYLAFKKVKSVVSINQPLYYYYSNKCSATHTRDLGRYMGLFNTLDRVRNNLSENSEYLFFFNKCYDNYVWNTTVGVLSYRFEFDNYTINKLKQICKLYGKDNKIRRKITIMLFFYLPNVVEEFLIKHCLGYLMKFYSCYTRNN